VAVPLKRYDGGTIAAICVAAWVEDSSMGSFAEKYLEALRAEAETLQPQLL
jgi:IclR family pca regulon transcriptional regulator